MDSNICSKTLIKVSQNLGWNTNNKPKIKLLARYMHISKVILIYDKLNTIKYKLQKGLVISGDFLLVFQKLIRKKIILQKSGYIVIEDSMSLRIHMSFHFRITLKFESQTQ